MLKVVVTYPSREDEPRIIRRMMDTTAVPTVKAVAQPEQILAARELLDEVYVDDKLLAYVVDLACATRQPEEAGLAALSTRILYGASPRASIHLVRAARARAFLEGRGYVTPHDIKTVGMDVLRHRVITTYEAEAEGLRSEDVIQEVFDSVPVP
jgi:MoxR-like ATPase